MFSCERCHKTNRQCIIFNNRSKYSQYIQDHKSYDLWISETIWRFIDRVKSKLTKNVEKNCRELKELLNEQRHCIEKYNQFFWKSNKKFKKKSLKILCFDKMRRYLDKRKEVSYTQNSDLLNLLNNLNSDQENFTIQCSFDFEHSVSSKCSLMMIICFIKSLLTSD